MNEIPIQQVQPEEPIGASMLNQFVDRLNDSRIPRGDDNISVSQIGGAVITSDDRPQSRYDQDWLVYVDVRGTLGTTATAKLGGGMYFCRPYANLPVSMDALATIPTTMKPSPDFTSAILWNLDEADSRGHSLTRDCLTIARLIGYTKDGAPLFGAKIVRSYFLVRITAVSGTFPAWSYTCQRITGYDSSLTGAARWVTDGVDITVLNSAEFAPASGYPYTYGNGSNITASDGTVDSGACVIIPIGVGAVVDVTTNKDTTGGTMVYSFVAMNSAEAP